MARTPARAAYRAPVAPPKVVALPAPAEVAPADVPGDAATVAPPEAPIMPTPSPAEPTDQDWVVVTLKVGMAGVGFSRSPGDPHRCDPTEAQRLRDADFAEPEA